ncbi:hypothetical protein HWB90_gp062 [Mycobacterium phage Fowlmouth]|uniref:Uncharacterized protein n=1 Tax=Mycobacterium phage Fowlmouth TaxID=2419978 RepID=A0A3G2KG94_9CAUD|nr:hypothetical protein HWB90_gp062 [Mycobacterium phage Fowlmouth]AYN58012.1 hypothetical protein SEA_FOWLMOUTH_62 [Mycobacterium phage Fowlmouth]
MKRSRARPDSAGHRDSSSRLARNPLLQMGFKKGWKNEGQN